MIDALHGRDGARLVHVWPIRCVGHGRPLAARGDDLALAAPGGELHWLRLDGAEPRVATFGFQPTCPAFDANGMLLCGAGSGVASMLIHWRPGERAYARNVQRDYLAADVPEAAPGVTAVFPCPDTRWAALVTERVLPARERVGQLAGDAIAGTLWLWDLNARLPVWSEAIEGRVTEAAFTPDGTQLRYRQGLRVETRQALTGRWLAKAPLRLDAPEVVFGAQDRLLATWRPDERPGARDACAVVDLADGAIVHPLHPGDGDGPRLRPRDLNGPQALAMRARPDDAGEVLTGVVIWDVASGAVVDEIPLAPLKPVDARFLPDGGFVVATTEAGLLRFAPTPRTGLAPALPQDGDPGDAPTLSR